MKIKICCLALLILLPTLLVGCSTPVYSDVLYNKMNTDVSFTLYSGEGKACFLACAEKLDRAEKIFSRTDPLAELTLLNANTDSTVTLSPALAAMLQKALLCAEETGGLFDPTAGVLTDLYDVMGESPLPTDAAIQEALTHTGYQSLTLLDDRLTRPVGMRLDLGGIAKGYIAEELVFFLKEQGVSGGVLSLGGNVAVFGEKPDGSAFRVALRSPYPDGGVLGVLTVEGDAYISTSGAYERYKEGENGEVYHHIFDMQTGRPAESDLLSVTVIDQNGARADAWSTALFVAGYEEAIRLWEAAGGSFSMLLVREDGEIYTTPDLSFEKV